MPPSLLWHTRLSPDCCLEPLRRARDTPRVLGPRALYEAAGKRRPFSVQYRSWARSADSGLTVHVATSEEPISSVGSWGEITAGSAPETRGGVRHKNYIGLFFPSLHPFYIYFFHL